ncbi:hypothetical protein [uncultured Tissierella sp.]|uniref:hypothetical protein n=1 Tax=uncultured Tissierella sp. TaxID=448160 RepID=UPI002803D6B5|nr:hypothetical protein [uncultured Tissierella sp.]MDU5081999.1 hypothetical protein [Bacillota bacterium]
MEKEFTKERNAINSVITPILREEFGMWLNFIQMDTVIQLIEYYNGKNKNDPSLAYIFEEIENNQKNKKTKKKQNKNDKAMTKLESENISLKQENKELKSLMKDIGNFLSNKEENQQLKTS